MEKRAFQFAYIVDKNLPTPIYMQLVRAVVFAIRDGLLHQGQVMPSINSLSAHYGVTRSTIEKGYSELRDMGVLESYHGKGFFVKEADSNSGRRILFLFNTLHNFHKSIFDAFSRMLGADDAIEMVIYDNDPARLIKIIQEKMFDYSHYLIVPGFSGDSSEAYRLIASLPSQKLILLDTYGLDNQFDSKQVREGQVQLIA